MNQPLHKCYLHTEMSLDHLKVESALHSDSQLLYFNHLILNGFNFNHFLKICFYFFLFVVRIGCLDPQCWCPEVAQ